MLDALVTTLSPRVAIVALAFLAWDLAYRQAASAQPKHQLRALIYTRRLRRPPLRGPKRAIANAELDVDAWARVGMLLQRLRQIFVNDALGADGAAKGCTFSVPNGMVWTLYHA